MSADTQKVLQILREQKDILEQILIELRAQSVYVQK
jgi:hypothetical protein